MLLNPREKFFLSSKKFIIHALILLAVIANMIPFRIPEFPRIFILIDTIAIYLFVVRNVNVFSYTFIFILGVWYDALIGLPLGTTAIANMIATRIFIFISNRILTIKTFIQEWFLYLFFVSFIVFEKWILLSIFSGGMQLPVIYIMQVLLSGLLYIPLYSMFNALRAKLVCKIGNDDL